MREGHELGPIRVETHAHGHVCRPVSRLPLVPLCEWRERRKTLVGRSQRCSCDKKLATEARKRSSACICFSICSTA